MATASLLCIDECSLIILHSSELCRVNLQALILSINEKYLKSGEPAKFPRRDLRKGQLEGKFSVSAEGHHVVTFASPRLNLLPQLLLSVWTVMRTVCEPCCSCCTSHPAVTSSRARLTSTWIRATLSIHMSHSRMVKEHRHTKICQCFSFCCSFGYSVSSQKQVGGQH